MTRLPQNRTLHRRAGLAPLELTLALPIMLFVMGLMIIAGTTGSWKARAVTNTRQSVWRTLWPRDGHDDPNPRGWPAAATMERQDGRELIEFDPYSEHDVVRGQPLAAPSGEVLRVEEGLFDMQDDVVTGLAEMQRPYPVMGNMGSGRIHLQREHPILDNRWQFQEMGLGANRQRRVTFLYPADYERALTQQVQRYHNAALEIVYNPDNPVLDRLDDDDELEAHPPGALPYSPPYGLGNAPDYHIPQGAPRREMLNPNRVCSDNVQNLSDRVVSPLVRATERLPERMTRDHLRMYNAHLDFIERLREMLDDPATPPDVRAMISAALPQMNADEQQLEQYVDQLEQFRDSLQQ